VSGLRAQRHEDIVYPATVPFLVLHLLCVAAVWTGVTPTALALCLGLYLIRLFGVTAGYHRYFSHRTYRTSRVGQFVLAVICQSSTQRGVLWWAAIHRYHHLHSDTELDVHSRRQHGFWYAHMGWIFARSNDKPDYSLVQDLARYPELVWLDRHPYFWPTMVAVIPCWLLGGWSGLIVGFVWSTTLLYHVSFAINSMGHAHGKQPYMTGDDSRNSLWLSLITLGEGWHNNHHAYQTSSRQGFQRGEIDPGYFLLKVLSWCGLVWDLREPPEAVVRNEIAPGRRVIEKVARDLAATYEAGGGVSASTPDPTLADVHHRARFLFPDVPQSHLVGVTQRAHELVRGPLGHPSRSGPVMGPA